MSEKFPISKSAANKKGERAQLVVRDNDRIMLYLNTDMGGAEIEFDRKSLSSFTAMFLDIEHDLAEIEASEKPKAVKSAGATAKDESFVAKPAPKPKPAAPKVAAPKKPAKKK